MKAINTYINEKLVIGNNLDKGYNYYPKDKDELIDCIIEKIDKEGYGTENKPLNLNDIYTYNITDMSKLFDRYDGGVIDLSKNGYFNISDWDVSNVENMNRMFWGSSFNGNLSDWNVSNVRNMRWMFAESEFDGDISNWNVSNVENMDYMFGSSNFTGKNGNISDWNVSNVKNMRDMFRDSNFNGDISNWDVSSVTDIYRMFYNCPLQKNLPKWYTL